MFNPAGIQHFLCGIAGTGAAIAPEWNVAVAATVASHVPREPRRLTAFLAQYPRITGVFALCVGAVMMVGWLIRLEPIDAPIVPEMGMVANTAIMTLLAGLSLLLLHGTRRAYARVVVARLAAVAVAALAIATLIEYLAGIDFGLGRIVPTGEEREMASGRSAAFTAVGFALVGFGLFASDWRTAKGRFPSDAFAFAAGAIAILALIGYLFGVPALYGQLAFEQLGMSIATALVLLSLALGVLALNLERGVLSVVVARDAGGVVARGLLAGLALFPPVAFGIILGARLGWYTLPIASALLLVFALAEASVFITATAKRMNRIDHEQQRVANELRASEAWVRSLFEQAKDGIFIADRDGRYIDVNPAGASMFGYTRDEILGKRITDLLMPGELARFERERQQILAGKTTRNEWEMRHRDGTPLTVEVVANMLPDGRWQAICRDVTERRAYRVWLRNIVDQLPEGVVVVDEDERVQVINRAMTAWASDPTSGDAWTNPGFFDVRDMEGKLVPFEKIPLVRAVRSGRPIPGEELQLRQPDGTMIQVEVRAVPLFDGQGHHAGAVVVAHDISERKELERLRDEWIAVIAHDLRQPLTAILVSVDMLHEQLSPAHEQIILDGLRKAAYRLIRMVDDLLDDARLAARELTVERHTVDMVAVVSRSIEQARMAHPGTAFEIDAPGEIAASIDQQRIEQVLGNLLSNAIKYRDPDTAIRIEVRTADDSVRVGVFNRGAPIEPDEMSQLFGRFHRTRSARGKPGIGLGLYVCKGLVEAHGGRIWVESTDGWTKFYFTVPPASQPARKLE